MLYILDWVSLVQRFEGLFRYNNGYVNIFNNAVFLKNLMFRYDFICRLSYASYYFSIGFLAIVDIDSHKI